MFSKKKSTIKSTTKDKKEKTKSPQKREPSFRDQLCEKLVSDTIYSPQQPF